MISINKHILIGWRGFPVSLVEMFNFTWNHYSLGINCWLSGLGIHWTEQSLFFSDPAITCFHTLKIFPKVRSYPSCTTGDISWKIHGNRNWVPFSKCLGGIHKQIKHRKTEIITLPITLENLHVVGYNWIIHMFKNPAYLYMTHLKVWYWMYFTLVKCQQ